MAANQPQWPRAWLMTDERIGDRLWEAIDRLPASGGIVFRHYSLGEADRLALGQQLAERARQGGLLLAVAGNRQLAEALDAKLVHNPDCSGSLPWSMAVHSFGQAQTAQKAGAAIAFIAPIYSTQSHPGAPVLGAEQAVGLAREAGCPAIALGGMDEARFRALEAAYPGAFHGFAGIDCWLRT